MATCGSYSQNVTVEGQEGPVQQTRPVANFVAIDFGTTSSSLAYRNKEGKIENLDIDSGRTRVPTAMLMRKQDKGECKVESFGTVAQDAVFALSTTEYKDYHYFEFFKMNLHQKNANRRTPVCSLFGGQFYLVQVIAFVLGHLKSLLLQENDIKSLDLNLANVHWVITVPAIWNPEGKQMMREAAYMACLWSNDENITELKPLGTTISRPTNVEKANMLTLALESECSAFSCRKDEAADYADHCEDEINSYLVFDIGGGTVDTTALKYIPETESYEVVLPPMGNESGGGTKVNEEFSKFLQKVVQDKDFSKFLSKSQSEHEATRSQIINYDFEKLKTQFGRNAKYPGCVGQKSIKLRMLLHRKFVDFYKKKNIQKWVRQLKDPNVSFNVEQYTLEMTYVKMAEFFEPVLQGITDCIVNTTAKLNGGMRNIDVVYISGGFGGCQYVFRHVHTVLLNYCDRQRIKSIPVTVPKYHKVAVSRGAIHYCMNPHTVSARIMNASYGIGIAFHFEEGRHSEEHAFIDENNVKFCQNVFHPFVHMNQKVTVNQSFTIELLPMQAQQTKAKFDLFRLCTTNPDHDTDTTNPDYDTTNPDHDTDTTNPDYDTTNPDHDIVHYITDKDVEKVGELEVLNLESESNDSARIPYSERKIQVLMTFGSTEIKAQARPLYLPEQPPVKAKLDFLSK